jgi:hypothetical protein
MLQVLRQQEDAEGEDSKDEQPEQQVEGQRRGADRSRLADEALGQVVASHQGELSHFGENRTVLRRDRRSTGSELYNAPPPPPVLQISPIVHWLLRMFTNRDQPMGGGRCVYEGHGCMYVTVGVGGGGGEGGSVLKYVSVEQLFREFRY